MKTTLIKLLLTTSLLLIITYRPASGQTKGDDIIGEWLTNTKGAHVLIYKQEGKYYGKLKLTRDANAVDDKNPDPGLRKRKLMGLVMLSGAVFDDKDTWKDATIYDAVSGKTYSCKLTFDSIDKLKVRGYIGISLFGRTEIWTRVK